MKFLSTLLLCSLMTIGCGSETEFLEGKWQVDVERTIMANLESLTPMSRHSMADVTRQLTDLELHFGESGRLTVARGRHSVKAEYGLKQNKPNFIELWVTDGARRESLGVRMDNATLWLMNGGDLIALNRKSL
ncbi:MAG: hypothetical protein ACON3Z_14180 [Bradymonadia bacterium]